MKTFLQSNRKIGNIAAWRWLLTSQQKSQKLSASVVLPFELLAANVAFLCHFRQDIGRGLHRNYEKEPKRTFIRIHLSPTNLLKDFFQSKKVRKWYRYHGPVIIFFCTLITLFTSMAGQALQRFQKCEIMAFPKCLWKFRKAIDYYNKLNCNILFDITNDTAFFTEKVPLGKKKKMR